MVFFFRLFSYSGTVAKAGISKTEIQEEDADVGATDLKYCKAAYKAIGSNYGEFEKVIRRTPQWVQNARNKDLAKFGPQKDDETVKNLMDQQEVSKTRKEKRAEKRKKLSLTPEALSAEKSKKKLCPSLISPNRFEALATMNLNMSPTSSQANHILDDSQKTPINSQETIASFRGLASRPKKDPESAQTKRMKENWAKAQLNYQEAMSEFNEMNEDDRRDEAYRSIKKVSLEMDYVKNMVISEVATLADGQTGIRKEVAQHGGCLMDVQSKINKMCEYFQWFTFREEE